MPMIAIKVPDDESKELFKIQVTGKKENKSDYHVTLFYFEKLNLDSILKTIECCFNVGKKVGALSIEGKEIISFPEDDDGFPIVLEIDSDDLQTLRKKLAKKLDEEKVNYSKKWPTYRPHCTLSYSREEFTKTLNKKISWHCGEVVLYAGEDMESGIICSIPLQLDKYAATYSWEFVKSAAFEGLSKLT